MYATGIEVESAGTARGASGFLMLPLHWNLAVAQRCRHMVTDSCPADSRVHGFQDVAIYGS